MSSGAPFSHFRGDSSASRGLSRAASTGGGQTLFARASNAPDSAAAPVATGQATPLPDRYSTTENRPAVPLKGEFT